MWADIRETILDALRLATLQPQRGGKGCMNDRGRNAEAQAAGHAGRGPARAPRVLGTAFGRKAMTPAKRGFMLHAGRIAAVPWAFPAGRSPRSARHR